MENNNMIKFTVYDTITGKIKRTGTCLQGDLTLQAAENESVIEGVSDPSKHCIKDNKIVDIVLSDTDKKLKVKDDMRSIRTGLLQSTDWTQLDDVPPALKQQYKQYRQQLRDITQQDVLSIDQVIWPVSPTDK